MKNYKQILEAVNRGINYALSDLEDDEELSSIGKQKQGQIEDKNYTRELLDLKKEVVNLGLPSGTLWCKYNLGVNINNITSPNQLIGDYYAWGEIEPNKLNNGLYNYSWKTYKYSGVSVYCEKMTKYCTDKSAGVKRIENNENYPYTQFADDLTQLEVEDDAAYQNKKFYNFKFHIPTKEQFEELIKYTTTENIYAYINHGKLEFSEHIEHDNKYNIYGLLLTSKINDNQIFFPFGSYKDDTNKSPFDGGHYWTSNLYQNYPEESYYMCCGSDFIKIYNGKRYRGLNIRPVINL